MQSMDNSFETLGQLLRHTRKSIRNISISELHSRTRLSIGFISKIETGEALPSPAALQQLAEALGISHELPRLIRMRAEQAKQKATEAVKRIKSPAEVDDSSGLRGSVVSERRMQAECVPDQELVGEHLRELVLTANPTSEELTSSYRILIEAYLQLGKASRLGNNIRTSLMAFTAAEGLAQQLSAPLIDSISEVGEIRESSKNVAEALLRVGESSMLGISPDYTHAIAACRAAKYLATALDEHVLQMRIDYRLSRIFHERSEICLNYPQKLIDLQAALEHSETVYHQSADVTGLDVHAQLLRPYSCAVSGRALNAIAQLLESNSSKTPSKARGAVVREIRRARDERREEARVLYLDWISKIQEHLCTHTNNDELTSLFIDVTAKLGILYRGIERPKLPEERDYSLAIRQMSHAIRLKFEQARHTRSSKDRRLLAQYHQDLGSTLAESGISSRLERALWQLHISARLHDGFSPQHSAAMHELMISVSDQDEKALVHTHVMGLLEEERVEQLDYKLFYEDAVEQAQLAHTKSDIR